MVFVKTECENWEQWQFSIFNKGGFTNWCKYQRTAQSVCNGSQRLNKCSDGKRSTSITQTTENYHVSNFTRNWNWPWKISTKEQLQVQSRTFYSDRIRETVDYWDWEAFVSFDLAQWKMGVYVAKCNKLLLCFFQNLHKFLTFLMHLTLPPISDVEVPLRYHFYVSVNVNRPNFRSQRPVSAELNTITVLYTSRLQHSLNSQPSTILPR